MEEHYRIMLAMVANRLTVIKDISLEKEDYNEEWRELKKVENSLIKLLKLKYKRGVI